MKQNETLRFILPILNEFEIIDDEVITDELQGCYIGDSSKPEYMNKLLMEYIPREGSPQYENVVKTLVNLPIFITSYERGGNTIFVLDIKEDKYPGLLDIFVAGMYSKFSEYYKLQILRFWGLIDLGGEDPISGILYQTETGREFVYNKLSDKIKKLTAENEFWPKPTMSRETL
jgi:hypothetical protein